MAVKGLAATSMNAANAIRKFSSTSQIGNFTKAGGMGLVSNIPYINLGGTVYAVQTSAGGAVTPSETVTATNVITAAESGKTFFLSSATEFVSTLPAPAEGLTYRFIVAAAPSGASYTVVTTSSANIIIGHVLSSQDAGGSADSETSGGDTVSFVDSKAVVGDWAEFTSDGTSWFVRASCKVFDGITITTAS